MSAAGFVNGVRSYHIAVDGLATKTVRELSVFALQKLVEMSPVGNPELWRSYQMAEFFGWEDPFAFSYKGYVGGRFRGNWQLTTGEPAIGSVPDIDPSGGGTLTKGVVQAQAIKDGEYPRVWITNNLPYCEALEDGHSTQAPVGVLAPAFQLVETTAQALVDSVVARDDATGGAR